MKNLLTILLCFSFCLNSSGQIPFKKLHLSKILISNDGNIFTTNKISGIYYADIDGDGDQDLIGTQIFTEKADFEFIIGEQIIRTHLFAYQNMGKGRFSFIDIETIVGEAKYLKLTDLDNDSDIDILVLTQNHDLFHIWHGINRKNEIDNTTDEQTKKTAIAQYNFGFKKNGEIEKTDKISICDFNQDACPDVLSYNDSVYYFNMYINNNNNYPKRTIYTTINNITNIKVGKVNNTSNCEFLLVQSDKYRSKLFWADCEEMNFTEYYIDELSQFNYSNFIDIDNDGMHDICASNRDGLFIYLNNKTQFNKIHLPWKPNEYISSIKFIDFDGDLHKDLIIKGSKNIWINSTLYNWSHNSYSNHGSFYSLLSHPKYEINNMITIDIDNDNDIDIVYSTFEEGVIILENTAMHNRYNLEADRETTSKAKQETTNQISNINIKKLHNQLEIKTIVPNTPNIKAVNLYNLKGQLVFKANYNSNKCNLDLTHVNQGIYIIQIWTDNGQQLSEKISIK